MIIRCNNNDIFEAGILLTDQMGPTLFCISDEDGKLKNISKMHKVIFY